MAEHRIVVPGVVGSTPITHPTFDYRDGNVMITYHLGIDIGGSNIKYALGDNSGDIIFQSLIPTPTKDLNSFLHAIFSIIGDLRRDFAHYPLASIGIASPGTIDRESGELRGVNPNLPFWTGIDPARMISRETGLPVFLDNDANLMTLAEASHYPKAKVVLGITVGTGIGSGLVIDGKVYHGGRGYALELGHTCVVPGGEICNCGLQGCVEAYSSLTGIRRRAGERHDLPADIPLKEIMAVAAVDPKIKEIVDRGEEMLCRGLANAIISFDPDVVVIGGGCMDGGLYEIESIRERLLNGLLPQVNLHTGIHPAIFGNQAGMIGALILASGH